MKELTQTKVYYQCDSCTYQCGDYEEMRKHELIHQCEHDYSKLEVQFESYWGESTTFTGRFICTKCNKEDYSKQVDLLNFLENNEDIQLEIFKKYIEKSNSPKSED